MGLAISYGDSVELIDPISSSDGFEYKLTSTISKMINTAASLETLKGDDKIKLYVIMSSSIKKINIWYKKLIRNPKEFNNFIESMKSKYKLRTSDKVEKIADTIGIVSNLFNNMI